MMTKKIGFNFLWMFSYHGAQPEHVNVRELDFIAARASILCAYRPITVSTSGISSAISRSRNILHTSTNT